MSTVVNQIPSVSRASKYDYDTLFNGEIHRLVEGEDFTVDAKSVRGAFYAHKAKINKENPSNKIGLTVQFRTEDGKSIVYVQKTDFKERGKKAETTETPAEPEAKAETPTKPAAKKTAVAGRKPVTPTPAQQAAAAAAAE